MSSGTQKTSSASFGAAFFILALIAIASFFAFKNLQYLNYDASADTLVAENDEALAYFLEVSEDFGDGAVVFLTYEPRQTSLLSPASLEKLAALQTRLENVKGVTAVTSLLDAPLFRSPPIELTALATDYKTLRSPDVDLALAQGELTNSPLYRELLISPDGRATALRISLATDQSLEEMRLERQRLRALSPKSPTEKSQLRRLETDYQLARRAYIADQERLMDDIRAVRDDAANEAISYLAGVPMIASDMVGYVKNDIVTFGSVSLLVLCLALFVFFRQVRWVILPIATALLSVLITSGILGFLRQPVTVISSNFVALLIIFSISFTVHLMVRYRELASDHEQLSHRDLLTRTMIDKFSPCLYTALTTMAAFASLTFSDIVPVDDLGWIMCIAMVVAFILNYTFFPAIVRLLPATKATTANTRAPLLTGAFSYLSLNLPRAIILLALIAAGVSWLGMSRLTTESRFIDYFKDTSEIKQGMVFIDQNLGGTTPMDVILSFEAFEPEPVDQDDDFFAGEPDAYPERYWYTPDKIAKLHQLHSYLETLPEVGKIISLATLEEVARDFNNGAALNTVQLAAIVGELPEDLREEFLAPYSTPKEGRMRISLRMRETAPRYSRDALIKGIEDYAVQEVGFAPEDVRVTGVNVLFNNMLKILFQSQRATISFVVLATTFMFLILLRSPLLALVGVIPNLLSAGLVLGFMGFMGITLDMMTITIAAIIIGIGVDDAIHYLHRFKQERAAGRTRREAIEISHQNIGSAIYFTSLTVIAGFSVLAFSNFIPTINFGLLTAMAMILSLIVNLVVLPSLLMVLGKD